MPDLKVYVNADPNAPTGKPKYYSAAQVEGLQAELDGGASRRRSRRTGARRNRSRPIQQQYPAQLQFVVRLTQVREAVPGAVDLARRPVHLHQGGRDRAAGALRGEGRQAGAAQLPGAPGHLRRAEGASTRATWRSARSASRSRSRSGDVMDDTPPVAPPATAPVAAPTVTDRRPSPRGVLPRGVQTWLLAGLAAVHAADHARRRAARRACPTCAPRRRLLEAPERRPRARLSGAAASARGAEPCAVAQTSRQPPPGDPSDVRASRQSPPPADPIEAEGGAASTRASSPATSS